MSKLEWKVNKTETETKSSYDNVESRDCESLAGAVFLDVDAMANTERGEAQEARVENYVIYHVSLLQ
jgi:hypothetical protein